jgi:hypothetical protein
MTSKGFIGTSLTLDNDVVAAHETSSISVVLPQPPQCNLPLVSNARQGTPHELT